MRLKQRQVAEIAIRLVIGASHSLDLLAPSGGLSEYSTSLPIEEILTVADDRIPLRWIVPYLTLPASADVIPVGSLEGEAIQRLPTSILEALLLGERQFRVADIPPTEYFLLVDQAVAIASILDSKGRETNLQLIEDKQRLASLAAQFDRIWSGHEGRKLYSDETSASADVQVVSKASWDAILERLRRQPGEVFSFSPRQFEELVAEILSRQGLRVKLTPASRDGGRDVLAFLDTKLGEHLYYVECKRYSADRPVGLAIVRQLYGAVSDEATMGLLVTTSRFTRDAVSFGRKKSHRLSLHDYDDLVKWLGA